jgi:toxin-antitoxin system PIN domain toxin
MSAFLLDVNVLVALVWSDHDAHEAAQRWFSLHSRRGWATCPFTQAGLVRILSNAVFFPDAVTPAEALAILGANLQHWHHRFWSDEITFPEAVQKSGAKLVGHRQVTDAYLLGLAIHHGGTLATLDRSLPALVPENSPSRSRIELI